MKTYKLIALIASFFYSVISRLAHTAAIFKSAAHRDVDIVSLKRFMKLFKHFGLYPVIAVNKSDKFSRCRLNPGLSCPHQTFILRFVNDHYPAIFERKSVT